MSRKRKIKISVGGHGPQQFINNTLKLLGDCLLSYIFPLSLSNNFFSFSFFPSGSFQRYQSVMFGKAVSSLRRQEHNGVEYPMGWYGSAPAANRSNTTSRVGLLDPRTARQTPAGNAFFDGRHETLFVGQSILSIDSCTLWRGLGTYALMIMTWLPGIRFVSFPFPSSLFAHAYHIKRTETRTGLTPT